MKDRIEGQPQIDALDIVSYSNFEVNYNETQRKLDKALTQVKQDCIAVVEGKKIEVNIISTGTGKKDGHADFKALAHNQTCDDIIKALSE